MSDHALNSLLIYYFFFIFVCIGDITISRDVRTYVISTQTCVCFLNYFVRPSVCFLQMLLQKESSLRREAEEARATSSLDAESAQVVQQQEEEQAGREMSKSMAEMRRRVEDAEEESRTMEAEVKRGDEVWRGGGKGFSVLVCETFF